MHHLVGPPPILSLYSATWALCHRTPQKYFQMPLSDASRRCKSSVRFGLYNFSPYDRTLLLHHRALLNSHPGEASIGCRCKTDVRCFCTTELNCILTSRKASIGAKIVSSLRYPLNCKIGHYFCTMDRSNKSVEKVWCIGCVRCGLYTQS